MLIFCTSCDSFWAQNCTPSLVGKNRKIFDDCDNGARYNILLLTLAFILRSNWTSLITEALTSSHGAGGKTSSLSKVYLIDK